MKRRTRISTFLIYVVLVVSFTWSGDSTQTSANPLSVMEEAAGGIIPGNDTNLRMIEAYVVMEINETYGNYGSFAISFDGNYTIYNPNDTAKILIGAPFLSLFFGHEDSLKIEANGTEIDHVMYRSEYPNSSWEQYFEESFMGTDRSFAVCNITFEGYTNTTVRYRFDSTTSVGSTSNMWIYYDVGTARAWQGVTTEQVEFKTYGRQPDSYSNTSLSPTTEISVTDIKNGKSYLWKWDAVIIEENSVMITYYFPENTIKTPGYLFLSTLACLVISTRLIFNRKRTE